MTISAFFVFGLIIGSFLNVVLIRRGTRSLAGRSGCMSCRAQLRWTDLIPVVSWLVLGGKCRTCGSRISVQYPLVELSTGIMFALIGGAGLSPEYLVLFLPMGVFLILIAAYDIRHTIIPDEWAYLAAGIAFGASLAGISLVHESLLLTLLAGPVAALPLAAMWYVSRGRWMGLGDAKLALAIGWLLGPVYGIYAVFLSFVIGAVISLAVLIPLPHILRVLRKSGIARGRAHSSYTMKSEVPFGPFLILSCCIVWFSLMYAIPLPALF
ncbi:prepilin peptidase [Candidatus Kaiserbacteria bacterium]|nr:prepilin peptidase [Candidatus Kaiserbacteria bacterium]